ncbi:MAG: hypothetical protein ACE5OZ_10830 [Candidatus Heimdallarchaeota archaeon]
MRKKLLLLVIILPLFLPSAAASSERPKITPLSQMQDEAPPPLMATNFAGVEIDGDLSEWSPDEFREFDSFAPSDRGINTSIEFQIALNESHYFGYIIIEDDAIFSDFPFRDSDKKVSDLLFFEFHDAARVTGHDGFVLLVSDDNYSEELLEGYGIEANITANITNFESINDTTIAMTDLDYIGDYDDGFWNATTFNDSKEWVNASYEDGFYTIWFAKPFAEFNITEAPGFPILEVEFSRSSTYSDGTISPFHPNASLSHQDGMPLEERVTFINASGETADSLDWANFDPSFNATKFSKYYTWFENKTTSMAFRNNGDEVFGAMQVDLPYVNQTIEILGETLAPLHLQMWWQVNETVAGETRSTKRMRTTIFNDNLTSLFAGIQEIESGMGAYPNNVDHGQWWAGDNTVPQEVSFAYTINVTTKHTYFIEIATESIILDIEEYGNGSHGPEIAIGTWFWMDYYNPESYAFLVNETSEQRQCTGGGFGLACALWRLTGKMRVGGDTRGPQPFGFSAVTALYPIRNVTVSQVESQGLATVNARIVDEQPFVAKLTYEIQGEDEEKTASFQPSLEEGFYYAEIPDLENSDQVVFQITVQDRFDTTTTLSSNNFRFGKPSDNGSPASLGFAVLALLAFVAVRMLSKRIHKE